MKGSLKKPTILSLLVCASSCFILWLNHTNHSGKLGGKPINHSLKIGVLALIFVLILACGQSTATPSPTTTPPSASASPAETFATPSAKFISVQETIGVTKAVRVLGPVVIGITEGIGTTAK